MFSSLSWNDFFTYVTMALGCYYLIIGIVYYRNELLRLKTLLQDITVSKSLFRQKAESNESFVEPSTEVLSAAAHIEDDDRDEHTLLNELLVKLEQQIVAAGKKNLIKEELLVSIQLTLKQYSTLQYSSFAPSIENYIQSNVENQCSIYLTDEEVITLWRK